LRDLHEFKRLTANLERTYAALTIERL